MEATSAPALPSFPLHPGIPAAPGTPAGQLVLRDWGGWGNGVRLSNLLRAAAWLDETMKHARRARPSAEMIRRLPVRLRPFFRPGLRLYRISLGGRIRPIDIGMTTIPAGFRVLKHFTPPSQIRSPSIRKGKGRYSQMSPRVPDRSKAMVHLSTFKKPLRYGTTGDRRMLHAYEIVLQRQERTDTYAPRTWTFEE
ncbi:hypothetical protein [Maliponia aquimaris]|nr:hypothetical protein [Maliponia aquimaris]